MIPVCRRERTCSRYSISRHSEREVGNVGVKSNLLAK